MPLLPHELIDIVVEISDLIVGHCRWTSAMLSGLDVQSWILDTFLLISRRMSPLQRSQSRRLVTDEAIRGRLSPLVRFPMPISTACCSRKRYSMDWAFSPLRAILSSRSGGYRSMRVR
jgi:hypothetical protein